MVITPLPSLESSPVGELANKFDSSAKSALNDDGLSLDVGGDVDVLIAAFEALLDGDRHEANCESLELLFARPSARLREGDIGGRKSTVFHPLATFEGKGNNCSQAMVISGSYKSNFKISAGRHRLPDLM